MTGVQTCALPICSVDNATLVEVNEILRNHPVEVVGKKLRKAMTAMKSIKTV